MKPFAQTRLWKEFEITYLLLICRAISGWRLVLLAVIRTGVVCYTANHVFILFSTTDRRWWNKGPRFGYVATFPPLLVWHFTSALHIFGHHALCATKAWLSSSVVIKDIYFDIKWQSWCETWRKLQEEHALSLEIRTRHKPQCPVPGVLLQERVNKMGGESIGVLLLFC